MHNNAPVNNLDTQVLDAIAGSIRNRRFQATGLFRHRETQSGMVEHVAEPLCQPIRRQRFELIVAYRKPCYRFQNIRIAARSKDHHRNNRELEDPRPSSRELRRRRPTATAAPTQAHPARARAAEKHTLTRSMPDPHRIPPVKEVLDTLDEGTHPDRPLKLELASSHSTAVERYFRYSRWTPSLILCVSMQCERASDDSRSLATHQNASP